MIRKMAWMVAGSALLVAACWVTAQATPSAKPTAVAVVDLSQILNSLEEKTAIEADLQVQREQLKQDQAGKEQEIQQLQADLDVLSPGTEAYSAKQDQVEQKMVELQAWAAYQTQKLNREAGDQVERLYRKIVDAVAQTALASGYDLVLFEEQPIDFRGAKREQLPALIQNRKVIWAADSLDITQRVLTTLNEAYRSTGS